MEMEFESVLIDQTDELLKLLRDREKEKPEHERKRFTSRDLFDLPPYEMKKVFELLLNFYGEKGYTYSGFLDIKRKIYWIMTRAAQK